MSRSQRRLQDQRELGRRRVTVATQSTTVAGAALAAVFGIVLAQHSTATAAPHTAPAGPAATSAPAAAPGQAANTAPPDQVAPQTQQAPQFTVPAQPPAPAYGGGGVSSGGS